MAERPPSLICGAVLLGVEAAAAVAFGAVAAMSTQASRPLVGLGVAIIMAGFAALLAVAARGVYRGRRWSRGPALAVQLIMLPTAFGLRHAPTTAAALLMAALAVGVVVSVLHPRSTAVFVPGSSAGESQR